VLVGGRKAIGSAQFKADPAFLQHGEIARANRLAQLARFRLDEPRMSAHEAAPDLPPAAEVAGAIARGFEEAGGAPIAPELIVWAKQASVMHAARYRDPAWTWRR